MLGTCWKNALTTIELQKANRLVIVGIGNELRGDDAVGCLIIRQLQRDLQHSENRLLIHAGAAPENIVGRIRQFAPDTLLFIDAVDMKAVPTHTRLFDLSENFVEQAASTHTLSLKLIVDYLKSELNCRIFLLGIQPTSTAFDTAISSSVQANANDISEYLVSILSQ